MASMLAATGAAAASEGVEIEIRVGNDSSRTIACRATLAHWFAVDLASIEPGGSAAFALSLDRRTGTVSALNAVGDAMPVELLFCGYGGRVYETRALLPLLRPLDAPPASPELHFLCEDGTDGLACR